MPRITSATIGLLTRLVMQQPMHALVHRKRAADEEQQQRDDQRIEIDLAPRAERMQRIGGRLRALQAEQQQQLVAAIGGGMDRLGEHRAGAGERGRAELADGDAEVGGERVENGFRRFFVHVASLNVLKAQIHFDAARAVHHFADHRRFVEAVGAEDREHVVDRFRRARHEQAARGLRIGEQGAGHIVERGREHDVRRRMRSSCGPTRP